ASRYAELVSDKRLRNSIFKRIVEEHERTGACLGAITGVKERLAGNPLLARSRPRPTSRLPRAMPNWSATSGCATAFSSASSRSMSAPAPAW
ncbi:hypothetical protein CQA20_29230, partial [Klebsiella pneumoniae]